MNDFLVLILLWDKSLENPKAWRLFSCFFQLSTHLRRATPGPHGAPPLNPAHVNHPEDVVLHVYFSKFVPLGPFGRRIGQPKMGKVVSGFG